MPDDKRDLTEKERTKLSLGEIINGIAVAIIIAMILIGILNVFFDVSTAALSNAIKNCIPGM